MSDINLMPNFKIVPFFIKVEVFPLVILGTILFSSLESCHLTELCVKSSTDQLYPPLTPELNLLSFYPVLYFSALGIVSLLDVNFQPEVTASLETTVF